jgi:4-alpha-glucanotransferase
MIALSFVRAGRPHSPGAFVKPELLNRRTCGVLLHPTSLPGPHGSGDLGREARAFIDWLAAAGCTWWQMLPTHPVGPGNSPYSTCSAFSIGQHLISLDALAEQGLLERRKLKPARPFPAQRVDFKSMLPFRERLLREAFVAFERDASAADRRSLAEFVKREAGWLAEYALYQAIARTHPGQSWTQWPAGLALHEKAAVKRAREELRGEIAFEEFLQYVADVQWHELRSYGNQRGVSLIGDLPIFIAQDSADVWAHRPLFQLDARGRAIGVTGCPPDSFSRDGQLWGHPQYDWPRHQRQGFQWWIERFGKLGELFDAVRIDHFLGFHRHWWVSGKAKNARRGEYRPSPGRKLFEAVRAALGPQAIIAEDLGAVVPEALKLRDDFGFPGMRILQNAFWNGARYDQPHNHPPGSVAYTGTHDNDTALGWWKGFARDKRRGRDGLGNRERALRYLGVAGDGEVVWGLIRALYGSPANTVVVPMQDVLELDSRGRMNTPATPTGNWEWRMPPGSATAKLASRLAGLADAFERRSTP